MTDEENLMTFNELRKTQKEEMQEKNLTKLESDFFLRTSNYLDRKKKNSSESEFNNTKRVVKKIVSLREDKIISKAKLSLKTDIKASNLKLLPEEQELYRKLKKVLQGHRNAINKQLDDSKVSTTDIEENKLEKENSKDRKDTEEDDSELEENKETVTKSEDSEDEIEEGYNLIKATSSIPEFMGTDLEAYGPIDEGEELKIPEDNAEILSNRGNAEIIK